MTPDARPARTLTPASRTAPRRSLPRVLGWVWARRSWASTVLPVRGCGPDPAEERGGCRGRGVLSVPAVSSRSSGPMLGAMIEVSVSQELGGRLTLVAGAAWETPRRRDCPAGGERPELRREGPRLPPPFGKGGGKEDGQWSPGPRTVNGKQVSRPGEQVCRGQLRV